MDVDDPANDALMSRVAAAVSRRAAAVSGNVYEVTLREIPELRDDKPVLTLLASSVDSNVDTCLQIMRHRIERPPSKPRPRPSYTRAGWRSAARR